MWRVIAAENPPARRCWEGFCEKEGEWSRTLAQSAAGQGLLGAAEAELSAHHGGGADVPAVVAHRAPLAVLQHLHSALADHRSASETHQGLLEKTIQGA